MRIDVAGSGNQNGMIVQDTQSRNLQNKQVEQLQTRPAARSRTQDTVSISPDAWLAAGTAGKGQ